MKRRMQQSSLSIYKLLANYTFSTKDVYMHGYSYQKRGSGKLSIRSFPVIGRVKEFMERIVWGVTF